ncbi:MAG: TonB-dependent hemoglobin/transferrin/lactoferrin family receptor [Pseudomonadota bacterium]
MVGTRTERAVSDVAATVTIKDAEEIERELARDIADLIRFEPGVSVGGTGSRFGLAGFNIRGVDGNRVLTLVDGVRVPEEFSFGPFLSARRDFVDIDSLDRVEIARGPISSLFGSDALGGVVAFSTRRPQDYLRDGENMHAAFRAGYSSADEALNGTLDFALGNERFSALLTATRRDGSETETAGGLGGTGPTREQADPQDVETENLSLKLGFSPAERHQLLLTLNRFDNQIDSEILSDYNTVSRGVTTLTRETQDERDRRGVTLDYRFQDAEGWLQDVQLKVYRQESTTEQLTIDERAGFAGLQTRRRFSEFEQQIDGAYAQATSTFETGGITHTLTVGGEYYQTDSESLRDGGTVDAVGAVVPEFFPLPTRDFPSTQVTQTAFFIQDEIALLGGRLLLSPGLRYDRFDADVNADAIYRNGNPGIAEPEDYRDSEVTGKFGAVFDLTEAASVYGRYSQGFRAPPYDDVNVGFTNFIGGYKTISNPDLVSETSDGLEFGFRWQSEPARFAVAVFRNDYEDFIESLAIAPQFLPFGGIDPADNLLTFQSVNRAEVRIEGIEFTGELALGELTPALTGVRLRTAIAYADGEDRDRGEPLNTVEPLTAVLGIGYDAPSGRFGGDVRWTLVDAKDESDIDAENPRLATAGYGIVDLLAYVRFSEQVSLNVGLFNLGDKDYIRWADTGGIGGDAPGRFTQPGFNAAATLRIEL